MSEPYVLETPFGKLSLLPTDGNHIYVDGNLGPITINRVDYSVSVHLYKWADDNWHVGLEGNRESQLHSTYLSRRDHKSSSYETHSNAKHKLEAALSPLVTQWAKTKPEALLSAESAYLLEQYQRAEDAMYKAKEELEKRVRELEQARVKLECAKWCEKKAGSEKSVA
jgi:hypothetical protein